MRKVDDVNVDNTVEGRVLAISTSKTWNENDTDVVGRRDADA